MQRKTKHTTCDMKKLGGSIVGHSDEEQVHETAVRSTGSMVLHSFLQHNLARVGLVIMLVITLAAVFAPFICRFDPTELHLEDVPDGIALGPNAKYWFGTDNLGRDYFSRAVYGARISLVVGLLSMVISFSIGIPLGCISGYYGGIVDSVICRITEFLMCIPTFFLILTINAMVKPSIFNVVAIIGAFSWMGSARVLRGQILSVKNTEYAKAARAMGLPDHIIILRHLLPNAIMPLVVAATMSVCSGIIMEAGLSYLGMGVQEPFPSWGGMLSASRRYMMESPHLALVPGTLICVVALALNFIGDGLRDAIDPKNSKR